MPTDTVSLDRTHVFRSWSAQKGLTPTAITGGEGAWFWDEEGTRYLDFCSQRVNLNLGHQHPKMVEALVAQAQTLTTLGQIHATRPRSEAARLIAERTPGDLNKIFFTNCGTDAVEHAVRMARVHTGRQKIMTMHRSYHGSTGGSISLTGDPRRWGAEPGMPGVVRFFGPYLYRSSFGAKTEEEETVRALGHLRELLQYEGAHTVAAILIETIVGSNGLLMPPKGYLEGLRALCDEYGILLICDEVMVGFGRCGEWFAANLWGVTPDLITFAKGVNSGYVPLGGVAISSKVAETFDETPFPGGGTYYGHPLACAMAVASIQILEEEGLLERARWLGENILGPGLRELAGRHPSVGDVRGVGCFWLLELVKDAESREPLVPFNAAKADKRPMTELDQACRARGLWPLAVSNRLHVCPPLVISDEDARLGLSILDEALNVADSYMVGTER